MPAATRDAFADALVRAGDDERIVVLTGDLRDSTLTEKFLEKYPDRFFDVGIAEKNMLGIAAGLSLSGKVPWACSFSAFVTGRLEVVRVSVAYQEANVRIVGTHSGIGVGEDGYSQMSLEDLALMRTLPNMAVVNPAEAVKAADALENEGISALVLNVHTIQPLDEEAVLDAASGRTAVVTVEDHSVNGGLGGAVAEVLAANGAHAPLRRVGMRTFGESGSPAELYAKYGLDADGIARSVREALAA